MANRILYKDQVLVDFDAMKVKSVEVLTAQSGSLYPETNKFYRQTINSNTNIVLPTNLNNNIFNQIIMQIEVVGSPTIGLGTTFGYDTIPTITSGKYKLTYDYDGTNWIIDIKKQQ